MMMMMMQEAHAVEIRQEKDQGHGRCSHSTSTTLEQEQHGNNGNGNSEEEHDSEVIFVKGEVQEPEYRDVYFAYLFYVQMVGVLLTAMFYGPALFSSSTTSTTSTTSSSVNYNEDDDRFSGTTGTAVLILTVISITSMVSTLGCLTLMTKFSQHVITLSFVAAPTLLLGIAVLVLAASGGSADGTTAAMSLLFGACLFAALSACMYVCYRPYIPFAASTLKTALAAMECNKGLLLLSLAFLFVLYIWTALWVLAVAGIFATAEQRGGETRCYDLGYTQADGYSPTDMCLKHPPNTVAILALLLSLYWTHQVITNVMHCTTAGTIGAWWYSGLGDYSVCSRHVMDSLMRALTFSFGSICLGSLLVAIMEMLERQARNARNDRHGGGLGGAVLFCVMQCLIHCLRSYLEYFNSWAYVYVGLYGYDYITAGRNVMTLFQQRGWSTFISDRLVFRVLYAAQLAVALVCATMAALTDVTFGPILESSSKNNNKYNGNDNDDSIAMASHVAVFFGGLILGIVLSSSALFVVESAVRTVIVCFAESPAEFQEYHPTLCDEMRQGWAKAYPDVFGTATITAATTTMTQGQQMEQQKERFPTARVLSMEHDVDPLQRQESQRLT